MARNTIKRMVQSKIRGVTNQNGYNDHFYRIYDDEGRIVGSKEGITTVPAEMMPRQAKVKVNLDGFKPRATIESLHPSLPGSPQHVIPQSQRRDADIVAEGRDPGATWTVQKQNWRNTPAQGELETLKEGGYAHHRPDPRTLENRRAPRPQGGGTDGATARSWGNSTPTEPTPGDGPTDTDD
jgi:hypothetical protein